MKEKYTLGRRWEGIWDNLVTDNICEGMTFEWYLSTSLNDQTPASWRKTRASADDKVSELYKVSEQECAQPF